MAACVGVSEQLVSRSLPFKYTKHTTAQTEPGLRDVSIAAGGRILPQKVQRQVIHRGNQPGNAWKTFLAKSSALPSRENPKLGFLDLLDSTDSSGRCRSQRDDTFQETADSAEVAEIKFEDEPSPSTSGSPPAAEFPAPTKKLNQRLALASVAVAVGMFAVTRGAGAGPDLNQLAAGAMQYDTAIANGRPTVVEFYADWCVVCREMAKEVYLAEQNYKDKVNFVLLNIDNKRWAEEVEEYGVGGIPHFVFLDSDGVEEGSAVGKLPRSVLDENLAAMARGDKLLPHSGVVGRVTEPGQRPVGLTAPALVEPRTHG